MKRWVEHDGKLHEIDLRKRELKVHDLCNGVKITLLDGRPILFRTSNADGRILVETPEAHATVKVYKAPPSLTRASESKSVQQIKSPMPALVVSVEKKVGDRVKKGDTVVVIEAMKMRTQLKAHIDGVVTHVYVQPGVSVSKGQLLAVVEAEPNL
ncbi:MAG: acetyl-CoA carboxylase biotin carboxyl carrier protein subunit [Thermotogae bacterium]|nr:acetyl-CoA carboxylase biotin carboxyl carrier protein subunit [Thermotogota bacterium]